MWKHSLYLIVIFAIILTAFGCGGDSDKIKAGLNEEFVLAVGESAEITGEDLEITFNRVTTDSRCAIDVTCVWAGEVTCAVDIKKGSSSSQIELTAAGSTNAYTKTVHQGYELSFQVSPYPKANVNINEDVYRLYLIVSESQFDELDSMGGLDSLDSVGGLGSMFQPPDESQMTNILGSVLADPGSFKDQNITVIGYYRGWDLLREATVVPPVTRSDWLIKDSTGAVYVNANSEAGVPEGLNPASMEDTNAVLEVKGVVRVTGSGEPYIEATSIEQLMTFLSPDESQMTSILGSVLADPGSFKDQNITIIGYYRGWDLLQEVTVFPPGSRSDWVIKDLTGAIYVSASSEAGVPEGLNPASIEDTNAVLEVKGVVRVTGANEPYIEATSIQELDVLQQTDQPQMTDILGSVLADPGSFKDQNITVIGYYRGWDLLKEATVVPPVTRSDWLIKDSTGAVYVNANSEAGVPEGLNPTSMEDTNAVLEVKGVVRVTGSGEPYIEATSIERL